MEGDKKAKAKEEEEFLLSSQYQSPQTLHLIPQFSEKNLSQKEEQENGENEEDNSSKAKKRKIQPYHRIKAHTNPLSDKNLNYPIAPQFMEWDKVYPNWNPSNRVEFADIGCGYGGLTVNLSKTFPNNFILGLEIRDKVVEYVETRLQKLRSENKSCCNAAVLLANAMKYLPNYFYKGQLKKIFFLFPDPHFKKSNHRRRIISPSLLAEYAYVLEEGGILYTVTDVEELHQWMVKHLTEHPLFRRMTDEELATDLCIDLVLNSSEESRKVDRVNGKKYLAVFQRIKN